MQPGSGTSSREEGDIKDKGLRESRSKQGLLKRRQKHREEKNTGRGWQEEEERVEPHKLCSCPVLQVTKIRDKGGEWRQQTSKLTTERWGKQVEGNKKSTTRGKITKVR